MFWTSVQLNTEHFVWAILSVDTPASASNTGRQLCQVVCFPCCWLSVEMLKNELHENFILEHDT